MAATKQSTTVRISEQTHHRLREMAAQSGEPMQAVLDKALEQYRRQKFWEATLMDGLDPHEDWSHEAGASLSEEKIA